MNILKNNAWQHLIPARALSRSAGWLANCDYQLVKNFLIDQFIKHYQVDLTDAQIENPHDFATFNDFFTRALKAEARPVDPQADCLVSPADGNLSEFGTIQVGQLLQAKGQHYSLTHLLANHQSLVDAFQEGTYATIYLAPKDYHRVHMPTRGELQQMIYVPGKLFSVNQKTTQDLPEVFANNERVICIFNTASGPMAVILVGAMLVASIATVWHGQVTPLQRRVHAWNYQFNTTVALNKAAEMGRFYLGSTVIVLFPKEAVSWRDDLVVGQALKMGQSLGKIY